MMTVYGKMKMICLVVSLVAFASCNNSAKHSYKNVYKGSERNFAAMNGQQPIIVDAPKENDDCCGDAAIGLRNLTKPEEESKGQKVTAKPTTVAYDRGEMSSWDKDGVTYISGKLKPMNASDKLYKYNVVIVTLAVKSNLDALLPKLEKDALPTTIAIDQKGRYLVVVASSDDEAYALQKRKEVIDRYTTQYTAKQLMQKYGMPFADTRIAVNE